MLGIGNSLTPKPQFAVREAPTSVEFIILPKPEPEPKKIIKKKVISTEVPKPKKAAVPKEMPKPVEKKKSQITPTVQGAIVEAQLNAQHNPTPIYPELARARGWEGLLVLKVKVEKDGKPSLIQLEQSSGHKILDRSAIRAIKKWTFIPARVGQKKLSSWIEIPVQFVLKESN